MAIMPCFVRGWNAQVEAWRLISSEWVGFFAPVQVCDQAISYRIERADAWMYWCFEQVSAWLRTHLEPWEDRHLVPWATTHPGRGNAGPAGRPDQRVVQHPSATRDAGGVMAQCMGQWQGALLDPGGTGESRGTLAL